jgi:hypothetical protein
MFVDGPRLRVGGDAASWEARTCVGRGRVLFSCNVKRAGDMGLGPHDRDVQVCLWEVVAMRMAGWLLVKVPC